MSEQIPAFAVRVSPAGAGAIHLLWLAGDEADRILGKWLGKPLASKEKGARLGTLRCDGETLDEVIWRPLLSEELSFASGFEISLHGGAAILEKTFNALAVEGVRVLDTGEFLALSRAWGSDPCVEEAWRAFLEARTEMGARLFFRQTREPFCATMSSLFGKTTTHEKDSLLARLESLSQAGRAANALRVPRRLVLCGRPNVGKSTLFNAIVGYERAIVSPQAGTTRDFVEEFVSLGGYPFLLADTAGVRVSDDPIEREATRLAIETAARADLAIFVWDGREAWTNEDDIVLAALGSCAVLRFPFRADSLSSALTRLEKELLAALKLPSLGSDTFATPISPLQNEVLAQAVASIRAGEDPLFLLPKLHEPVTRRIPSA